jgi:hypothetical protein
MPERPVLMSSYNSFRLDRFLKKEVPRVVTLVHLFNLLPFAKIHSQLQFTEAGTGLKNSIQPSKKKNKEMSSRDSHQI